MRVPLSIEALGDVRHEFGEHGGVNISIEASTTYTVMDPRTMPEIFSLQPTVYVAYDPDDEYPARVGRPLAWGQSVSQM